MAHRVDSMTVADAWCVIIIIIIIVIYFLRILLRIFIDIS